MQLPILGFHRSGTSAISQYLHHCGLFLGDSLMGAKESNPLGHFEDKEIYRLHKRLLKHNKQHWLTDKDFRPDIPATFQERIKKIIRSRSSSHEVWGFKDPRTCLFVRTWDDLCPEPRYIVILRHYLSCIDSVQRRAKRHVTTKLFPWEKKAERAIASDPDRICRAWINYMATVLEFIQSRSQDCLVFNVSAIDKDLGLSAIINSRYRVGLAEYPLSATFRQDLMLDTVQSIQGLAPDLMVEARELWTALLATCNLY